MKIRLIQIFGAVLLAILLGGCAAPASAELPNDAKTPDVKQLSLARLPADGYVTLDRVDEAKLKSMGLSPEPWDSPATLPFNQYGVYWSQQVQMYEGDTLTLKITSDTPVSWFGVDWKLLNLRGIVAKFDMDEDGHTFDAQYPEDFSTGMADGKYILTVKYKFEDDSKCVLLVKNNSADTQQQVMIKAGIGFNFSFEKVLKKLGLKKTEENGLGDPDG